MNVSHHLMIVNTFASTTLDHFIANVNLDMNLLTEINALVNYDLYIYAI